MNILLIEDDDFLLNSIQKVFEKKVIVNRFKAINSFDSFLNEIDIISSYDIIIVDIYLGKGDKTGIDIIEIIRKKNIYIPIVVISGCDDLNIIERAFEYGANDYLTKPFRLKELEIRIFKWFKDYFFSIKFFENNVIEYSGISYNIKENQFYFRGEKITLSKQNKYLLSIFLSHAEKFLTKKFLIDKIWGDIYEYESRNIRVSILRLKKDLEKIGLQKYVHTVRGEGYIFKK